MNTAVIYARYSSDSQSEQSIEGQLRVCEDYAKAHDILILDTYIDRAMTGTNDNRPDFQRMIKDSARREWTYILVYKLDRFSRNKYETAIHKKTLRDNGVKLLSAMENIPDTPEGIILESLLEGMNQYYSAELAQKVRRGMKETRLKGNYQGGGIPYGYKIEGRKIVIDEVKAEIVRYMYAEYSKGVFVKDIVKALAARGALYKGRPFAYNTVYDILKNEKYSGVYKHGDEVIENMYPRIIDPEIFQAVRRIVNANKFGKRSVKVDFLLRHKVRCGYCGESINAECGTARNGNRVYYYKCNGRKKRKNDCQKSVIRKEILESIILNSVITELSKPAIMETMINGLLKTQERQITENKTLELLQKEQRQIENALNNLVSAIERGITSKTTAKRLHELEERQEELERQIIIERSKTVTRLSKEDIRAYYEKALTLEPQMLVNYLIKEIVLFDDRIEIHFNSPIRTSPDDSQGFSFYSKQVELLSNIYFNAPATVKTVELVMYVS